MGTKYCHLCERKVETKRDIGIGSLLLVLVTAGCWILVIIFYRQPCTICKSDSLSNKNIKVQPINKKFLIGALVFILIIIASTIDTIEKTSGQSNIQTKSQTKDIIRKTYKPITITNIENIDYSYDVCDSYTDKEDKNKCILEIENSKEENSLYFKYGGSGCPSPYSWKSFIELQKRNSHSEALKVLDNECQWLSKGIIVKGPLKSANIHSTEFILIKLKNGKEYWIDEKGHI